jgi:RNA polymerase sigma-70 factor (ECF subfamily)
MEQGVDPERLMRAQSGDSDALDALLRELQPLVRKRCARLLPFAQDAEDATQDALLAIALKLQTYSGAGSFEGWVSAIATNQARMTYRSMKKRLSDTPDSEVPDRADSARTSVIAGSRVDLLEAIDALERAHPETVEPFMLRDFAAHTYEEIAEQTGAPLGTVKARIHTARTFLRTKLGDGDNLLPAARI